MINVVNLRPSEIYFPQDSILNKFSEGGTYAGENIGTVLDGVVDNTITVDTLIEGITVHQTKLRKGNERILRWATMNNRSLWVAKELELINLFPNQKPFRIGGIIPENMCTTKNGGEWVFVRKRPIAGTSYRPAPFWSFYAENSSESRLELLRNFKSTRIESGYFAEDLTPGIGIEDNEDFREKQQWFSDACKQLALEGFTLE